MRPEYGALLTWIFASRSARVKVSLSLGSKSPLSLSELQMKKTLMVAALTGVFATAAHAQSSVTLYGLIDAGFTYVNHAGHQAQKLCQERRRLAQR